MAERDKQETIIEKLEPGRKSPLLAYIGAFVLVYLVSCVVIYFILKSRYEEIYAESAAAADTAAVVPSDTTELALVDTTREIAPAETLEAALPETTYVAVVDTSLLAMVGEVPAVEDTTQLAEQRRRVARLVRIIDKMNAKETASIFAKLDDDFVVQLLLRMKERNAAKVLSIMPASRAARLTAKISEQMRG
ncbi:MAG: hypothetical protein HQ591_07305 [candidate division Zixibacteria bacterium]|nr:hypothetical protein [Candidatus Tariuqbacter arcticus]